MGLFKRQFRVLRQLSTVQMIVLFYLTAIVVSTIILSMPFFLQPGASISTIDTVFTAISAISVTGLTVFPTSETFNIGGYFALAFILQFGGIGIMTLGTFIYIILGKRIGLRGRQLISIDQNQTTLSGLVRLMLKILKTILLIEFVGMVVLSLHFLNYYDTWQEAWIQGFFASVSATTNAGFDITGNSLEAFANDYYVQFIHMILLVLGAIGFPVLIEVQQMLWGEHSKKRRPYRFSLYTKLTTATFFLLTVFGVVMILLLEYNHFFADKSWHESLFYSLFQSITTRNGGLATMDVSEFTQPTLVVLSFLMFVGASPSSVGGGIRTTTFAIVLLTIYHYAKGHSSIKLFNRELEQEDVMRSFIVASTAFLLCMISIIILMITEPFSNTALAFEVFSAFGTTGLSLGITPELSNIGKIVIMVLMFVGRIGIFSFIFLIRGNAVQDTFRYPREKMIIG